MSKSKISNNKPQVKLNVENMTQCVFRYLLNIDNK